MKTKTNQLHMPANMVYLIGIAIILLIAILVILNPLALIVITILSVLSYIADRFYQRFENAQLNLIFARPEINDIYAYENKNN